MIQVQSFTKYFNKKFGGQWKFNRKRSAYECNDNNRYILRVLTEIDRTGEYTGESSFYLYYSDNSKPTERVY